MLYSAKWQGIIIPENFVLPSSSESLFPNETKQTHLSLSTQSVAFWQGYQFHFLFKIFQKNHYILLFLLLVSGAIALSIMVQSLITLGTPTIMIKTFNMTTFNITTFNITTFNITTFNIMTFNITTFNITTFNLMKFNITTIRGHIFSCVRPFYE